MSPPLADADLRRIYHDALDRGVRHASAHVTRDEALDIGHHVAAAFAHRCVKEAEAPTGAAVAPVDSMDAFVHRAVLNRLREIWRARKRREGAEQLYHDERTAIAPAWTQPDANLESRELHKVIEAAVAALPDTRRQVFLLIRRDQRSYKEVAAQLGIGVGTVHTHLSRANAAVRQAVAAFNRGGEPAALPESRIIGTRS